MQPGERVRRGQLGKLTGALRELAEQARAYLQHHRPFADPVLWGVFQRWRAWTRGIPPTREPLGYGGQNPHLLAAFEVLDCLADGIRRTED